MATTLGLSHPLAEFAGLLADESGAAILPLYRSGLIVDSKAVAGPLDPVTVADRAAERAIRALIKKHYPEHGIIGEEFGVERGDAEYVWVIDPIDGTKAFISGMLTWGTLIGLLHHGEPVVGVVDQPYVQERFTGTGVAAFGHRQNGVMPLITRKTTELRDATVWVSSTVTTQPDLFLRVQGLVEHVRMLRYGSDCLSMAMLAEGHIDVVIEAGLEIYDIAAQIPLVRGAGGMFTSLIGGDPLPASAILAAGTPELHGRVLDLLWSGSHESPALANALAPRP